MAAFSIENSTKDAAISIEIRSIRGKLYFSSQKSERWCALSSQAGGRAAEFIVLNTLFLVFDTKSFVFQYKIHHSLRTSVIREMIVSRMHNSLLLTQNSSVSTNAAAAVGPQFGG